MGMQTSSSTEKVDICSLSLTHQVTAFVVIPARKAFLRFLLATMCSSEAGKMVLSHPLSSILVIVWIPRPPSPPMFSLPAQPITQRMRQLVHLPVHLPMLRRALQQLQQHRMWKSKSRSYSTGTLRTSHGNCGETAILLLVM